MSKCYIYEIFKQKVHLLVSELGVEWESNLIVELIESVGIVLYIKAQCFVGSHHGEWLIVDIAGNFTPCHFCYYMISELRIFSQESNKVEMARRLVLLVEVVEKLNVISCKCLVVSFNERMPPFKQ